MEEINKDTTIKKENTEKKDKKEKKNLSFWEKMGLNFWNSEWWWNNFFGSELEIRERMLEKEKMKYTKTYLEYKINKFFKKEKQFKLYWLDLYYNFNKDFSKIIHTPIYIQKFFSNVHYVTSSVINPEWDEIMNIYNKIIKTNPNYKNSRLDDPKPIYDRRHILLVTYHIFLLLIYTLSALFYIKISTIFMKIKKTLDIEDDVNSSFVVFIAYISFILGLYYGGLQFIFSIIILLFKALYYIAIIIYYLFYYFGWLLFILIKLIGRVTYKTTTAMTGGNNKKNKKNKKKMTGGTLYEDFENFMNEIGEIINALSIDLVVNVLNNFFENILPDEDTFETACKSTSNIEKMLAKQNSRRNTEEPININKKINKQVEKLIPEEIKKTDFVRCMLKKKPKTTVPDCN